MALEISTLASQLVEKERSQTEESDRVAAESGIKAGEAEEFVYDKEKEWEDAAEEGLASANMWKTIGGVVAGGIALATGMAPLAAALISAGGTFLGGKVGQHQFDQKMKGTSGYADSEGGGKWKAGSTRKLEKGLDQDLMMSTIMSFIMGGTQAGGAADAAAGEVVEEGAKSLGGKIAEGGVQTVGSGTGTLSTEALKKSQEGLGQIANASLKKAGKDPLTAEAISAIDPSNLDGFIESLDIGKLGKHEKHLWQSQTEEYQRSLISQNAVLPGQHGMSADGKGVFASKTGGAEAKTAQSTYSVSEGYQRNPLFGGREGVGNPDLSQWWEQAKSNVGAGLFGTGQSKWDQGLELTSIIDKITGEDENRKLLGT